MSFEEWQMFWREAGFVRLGNGDEVLAWKARGRDFGWTEATDCVQLRRWDLDKPWVLENTYAQYKGQVICNGFDVSNKIKHLEKNLKIVENNA